MTDLDLDAIEQRANQWASPLAVTCPSCGSAPGDRCYGNGSMSRPHDQRREAVRLRVIADVPALLAEVQRLQATVERVREMHVPFRIYGECECEDTTTPGHVYIEEVGITCNLLYAACRECCTSGADIRYQTEDCAYGHDHRDTYCATIAALDGDEQ